MSFETITSRLTGYIPRLPKEEAYNIVSDAWTDVRGNRLWSFQVAEDSVTTPNVVTAGTVTVILGISTVTLDATATAALTGLTNPLVTLRQFRVQGFSIYNIIGLAGNLLTLDRPYTDPTGAGLPYQVYQAYFAAPVSDFKRWLDWRDMVNGEWLSIYATRREVNMGDPQRLYYSFPHYVVPAFPDTRTGSSTLGRMLYELYPNPLSQISYMRWWIRRGADLVQPSDTLPFPMEDDLIFAHAKELAYTWMEGNRDPSTPRGQAADCKFLAQAAAAEYREQLKETGKRDRDLMDLYISRLPRPEQVKQAYYSTLIGRAYSGA